MQIDDATEAGVTGLLFVAAFAQQKEIERRGGRESIFDTLDCKESGSRP